jgi:hypothetical protein
MRKLHGHFLASKLTVKAEMQGNICVTGLQEGPRFTLLKWKKSDNYMCGYGKFFGRHLSSKPNYEENNFDGGCCAPCIHGACAG